MEDYNKLVEKNQTGEIDDFEFLLAQEDLMALYVTDMQAEGISPNAENAAEWLLKYENEHLYQQVMDGQANDKALQKFADLMVKKLTEVSVDWHRPWFTTTGYGLPQNIDGRVYNGINSLMLFPLQEKRSFQTPVYMTSPQAKKQGLRIDKEVSAFPVLFWNSMIKNDKGNKISMDGYKALTKEEQKEYTVIPYTRPYHVFNVDQINLAEVYPEQWKTLKDKFSCPKLKDEQGMFLSPELDHMIKHGTWLCPIISSFSDEAFFRPSEDKIYLPLRDQFYTREGFCSTLLHEMAHSTGIDTRLGREMKNMFGDPRYAKEELVAEFAAAVSCRFLDIVFGVREENAQYLKNWFGAIKKELKLLYSVLIDVGKASTTTLNEVCRYELLKKEGRGKQQEECKRIENKKVDDSKSFSETWNDEKLSPAFNIALAVALAGSFKELVSLKEQGYKLSAEELDVLKDADPKIYIAAQNIFNIKLDDPTPSLQFSESKNKSEVEQSSLNFQCIFIGHVTGYLGSDAKRIQKGHSLNVSTKYKEGNEEKTLWICCFLNYETKVAESLKAGTMVHVYREITVGIFKRDTGDTASSVTMSVDKVQLLSSKNKG